MTILLLVRSSQAGGVDLSFVTLGVLALLLCGLAVFETATSREFRRELRAR